MYSVSWYTFKIYSCNLLELPHENTSSDCSINAMSELFTSVVDLVNAHPPPTDKCLIRWQLTLSKTLWAASWQNEQNGMSSMISVFAVRIKKAWVLSYPLSAHRRLIRLGGRPGWSESSLGAQSFCWFCHETALIFSDVGQRFYGRCGGYPGYCYPTTTTSPNEENLQLQLVDDHPCLTS